MAWVKLDNGFREHRKVLRATPAGVCLWVCGLDYCNRQAARDGFIPAEIVPVLYPMSQPMKVAAKLVEAGLWEPREGGFIVHDYHDYQPTAEDAAATTEKRRAAGRLGGQRKAAKRVATEQQASSKVLDENVAKRSTVPVPVPDTGSVPGSLTHSVRSSGESVSRETGVRSTAEWDDQGLCFVHAEYPKPEGVKVSRVKCIPWWDAEKPDAAKQAEIVEGIRAYKATKRWQRDQWRYVPSLQQFLLDRMWESPPEPEPEGEQLDELDRMAAEYLAEKAAESA